MAGEEVYPTIGGTPALGTLGGSIPPFFICYMFTTYAIRSISRNYTYIGLTNNLVRRLNQHNKGYNRTTKPYKPFQLIYTKEFKTRTEAREHEKFLKSAKGRDFLKTIQFL